MLTDYFCDITNSEFESCAMGSGFAATKSAPIIPAVQSRHSIGMDSVIRNYASFLHVNCENPATSPYYFLRGIPRGGFLLVGQNVNVVVNVMS